MKQFWSALKSAAILYCSVFTIATIISIVFQLGSKKSVIIDRAIIYLIGVLAYTLITKLKAKIKLISIAISYAVSMPLLFAYFWFAELYENLYTDAYRYTDEYRRAVFIIFTVVFIIVSIIDFIKAKKRKSKQGMTQS